jgi:hypothetical protein
MRSDLSRGCSGKYPHRLLSLALPCACLVLCERPPTGEGGCAAGSLSPSATPSKLGPAVRRRSSPEFPFRFIWVLGWSTRYLCANDPTPCTYNANYFHILVLFNIFLHPGLSFASSCHSAPATHSTAASLVVPPCAPVLLPQPLLLRLSGHLLAGRRAGVEKGAQPETARVIFHTSAREGVVENYPHHTAVLAFSRRTASRARPGSPLWPGQPRAGSGQ